jgi:hypothetical protein
MRRRSTRMAGSLVALFVAAVAAGIPLTVANGPAVDEHPPRRRPWCWRSAPSWWWVP